LLRQIRYKESCSHVKLLRHRRCHKSRSPSKTIDVYPQIIVDVPKVKLNQSQLDYLSRTGQLRSLRNSSSIVEFCITHFINTILTYLGPNYIRPNQSYLYSYERRQKQVQQEYENIMDTVTSYLVRIYHMPNSSTIIKQFSQVLATCLYDRYMAPVSYLNTYRARKELKLVKSIQHRIKKEKYILRVTDKSGIFHLGDKTDYEQKAEAYRHKTGAYIELESDPLWPIFDKVVHLLNNLRSKDQIRIWQLDKMMPKRDKVALAYLYFIPKPHKVTNIHILSYNMTIYIVSFHRKVHH
jgi:hypothetical protein